MSNWLTFGQMIDRLGLNEIAESKNGCIRAKYIDNKLTFLDEYSQPLPPKSQFIQYADTGIKWKILPIYVTYDEAWEALKQGKYIALWNDQIGAFMSPFSKNSTYIQNLHGIGLTFDDWFNGKWTIIEDCEE